MKGFHSALPEIVSGEAWQEAHEALLKKEKAFTRQRDALAAERRRLPMTEVQNYIFEGPEGAESLSDLFDGKSQLVLYHFMLAPGVSGWPDAGCVGCSMMVDNFGQYVLPHLQNRDVSLAIVSLAPAGKIAGYRKRMGWPYRWVSSQRNTFNRDFGITTPQGERPGLSVFLKDGERIFRTYFTTARGLEKFGTVWSFLEVTPYGRREAWEDSPAGWPQEEAYTWWRRHDEYE